MENLFSGFHYINADLTGVDYQEIDKVLKSTNTEIRTAAIKELKGCFDLVNSVFEDGILPENVWTDEDMSEEWASQDQYTILKNCKSLFKYVDVPPSICLLSVPTSPFQNRDPVFALFVTFTL